MWWLTGWMVAWMLFICVLFFDGEVFLIIHCTHYRSKIKVRVFGVFFVVLRL